MSRDIPSAAELRQLNENLAAVVRRFRYQDQERAFAGQQLWTLASLAARYDCCATTVIRVAQRAGIVGRGRRGGQRRLTRAQVEQLDRAMAEALAETERSEVPRG